MSFNVRETSGKGFPNFMLTEREPIQLKIMDLAAFIGFFPDFAVFLRGASIDPAGVDRVLAKSVAIKIIRHYRAEFRDAYKAFNHKVFQLAGPDNREFGELMRVTMSDMRDTLFGKVHVRFLNGFSIDEQKAFALMLFAVFSKKHNVGLWIDFDHDHDEEFERCIVGIRRASGPIKSLPFRI